MVPLAAWFGWRAFIYLGPVAGCLVAAGLLGFAVPIMRTCLIANDEGLTDRRAIRTVRVPWSQITGFRVERPGGIWGGFCVVAARRDGTQADLLSTRAYSRAPSSSHLDELLRLCWTLEERLAAGGENLPSDP
ncbi:MAG TPA: PH domain-containing protein [Streptosporangiaceae bacterium]|nr:PH domain-containing protein [Streptosporangiaceae bacterium]